MDNFLVLDGKNIETEHICCAFSDKKCAHGYELKRNWLSKEFEKGYVFRRLDERAKVFMEYGPAETAWAPVIAPNYLFVNCFWVSGKYKGVGYAKRLLELAIEDAKEQGKYGLVTVAGIKKFLFMSDGKWLLKNGFKKCDETVAGFGLYVLKLEKSEASPKFNDVARSGRLAESKGLTAFYSNRCPFTEYYVNSVLTATAAKRDMPLNIIKIETMEQAQAAPTPATIFSLFKDGEFITTDLSICLEKQFDKRLNNNC